MAISFQKARDFVYSNGVLWERALFAYLFEAGSLERVHQCLLCYKNSDSGWGHALEHDIRTPESHPLALEFILGVMARDFEIPTGNLFDDASAWLVANQADDGTLRNPPSVIDYPHAPWWNEGGQSIPCSIVGNLAKLGKASNQLLINTQKWAIENLTIEQIGSIEWLFMCYRPLDYFMNIETFPDLESHRQAAIETMISLAENAPETQYSVLFQFASSPDARIAQGIPQTLIQRNLDYLEASQQDHGGWNDEHNLDQWKPYVTIHVLRTLQQYGRLKV
jgi:hypothetical protein